MTPAARELLNKLRERENQLRREIRRVQNEISKLNTYAFGRDAVMLQIHNRNVRVKQLERQLGDTRKKIRRILPRSEF